MQHLIILPGNSLKNKAWGELILEYYAPQFDSASMLEYDHWVSGEPNINFASEQAKIAAHMATLPPVTDVVIFAKSAGSLLAFITISAKIVTPIKCVFFGIPFDLAAPDLFKDNWAPISTFVTPAIAFHNIGDPTTCYEFTKQTIVTYAPHIQLIPTSESDHWYGDIDTYSSHLQTFLKLR